MLGAKHKHFTPRRWPVLLAFFSLVVLMAIVLLVQMKPQREPAFGGLPDPSAIYSAETVPEQKTTVIDIPDSRVVRIRLQSSSNKLAIDAPVLSMPASCRTVIEPPTRGKDVGSVFQCLDFASPGTHSSGLTVLAGHSSLRIDTVFNRLYTQGHSLVGESVYLKTRQSGKRWLVYRITAVYEPDKKELPYMSEVWGATAEEAAGRIVLVTCLQNPDGSDSDRNFVVRAEYEGLG